MTDGESRRRGGGRSSGKRPGTGPAAAKTASTDGAAAAKPAAADAAPARPVAPTWSDVLIVGGGMVGGTLAVALADAGLSVVCVEQGDPGAALADTFDGRCSAIALSSQRMLVALGLWPALAADACPMRDIRVADGQSRLFLHYDHRDVGHEPFGYMLENRLIRRAILERLATLPGARLMAPAGLVRLERAGDGVDATLADGTRLRATLAIAADGRDSMVRDEAGIRVTRWSYDQTAIVCTVRHARSHGFVAHEHFLPAGPFAILPLQPGDRSSIVWTERSDLAAVIMAGSEHQFLAELGRRFGDFLGEIRTEGPRFAYPLSLQYAERAVCRRLALVGDAAHAMHPIAGQGLNMGFRDVAALTEVLAEAKRRRDDLGASKTLARFQRWRRFDNTLMLAMTDGLNRLFSNDIAPIRLARDLGLGAVNRMPGLKRLFMRHAMGTVGTLPALMRR